MRRKLVPLIAGFLLLLGANASWALTLSDIRSQIRRNVRDTATSTSLRRYSDATLLVYINEAQRAIINETWALSATSATTVTAGTTYYSLPTNLIKVWRVTLDGANLSQLDLKQYDADFADAAWSTSGTPASFFYDRTNRNQIGLQPYPSSSGSALKVFYYQTAPDLASDSDVPFDTDLRLYSYHDIIIYYVSFRLLTAENRLPEAQAYQGIYSGAVDVMNTNVGFKPTRPPVQSKEQKP